MRYIIVGLILSLSACDTKPKEKVWIKPNSTPSTKTISCDEYYSIPTEYGVLTNNVWNKNAAENDSWSQCLEKRSIDGVDQFGWSWSWPFGRRVIYAQPQIKIGASPWAPEPKFDSGFPLQISNLKIFNISHALEVHTNGDHNTATSMWLVNEPYKGYKPNTSIIVAEVMIWTYATDGHFDPAGQKHSEIETADGSTWELWFHKDWEDKSGENENRWVYLAFVPSQYSMSAKIPGLELLSYAVRTGLISENYYIADVELGNEIMSGSGIAWVKEFNVDYETKH